VAFHSGAVSNGVLQREEFSLSEWDSAGSGRTELPQAAFVAVGFCLLRPTQENVLLFLSSHVSFF